MEDNFTHSETQMLNAVRIDRHGAWLILSLVMVTWIAAVAIYRLYFHPLAKYPGPLIAKVSDLYNVYHCYIGDRHLEFHRIHEKYGDAVRYGPNRVSINTATAMHTIYGAQANVRKSSLFYVFPWFFDAWSLQTMIDPIRHSHKAKRKILSHSLSDKSLRQLEERIMPIIRKFCAMLTDNSVPIGSSKSASTGWSAPKDMAKLTSYLSFDIMGQVCFGKDFEVLGGESNRYMLQVAIDGARCLNTIGHIQFLLRTGLHHIAFRKLLQGLYAYRGYSAEQCDHYLSEKGRVKSDNVFSHLCSARHPDTDSALYSLEELRSESSLLILAGSDTTSTCIAATIFYVLYNAHVLHRVQQEVRSAFTSVEDIRDGPLLNSCVYLRACIDESLRMSPPVGGLMPREIQKGGMVIDGEFFAEGMEVGTPSYSIHHSEQYYPDAFTYNPSRWIASENGGRDPEQQAQRLQLAKSAFNAWSVGNRSCVGRSMAYLEISVVLARLLWSFDMRLSEDNAIGGGGPSLGAMRRHRGEYQLWDAFASNNYGPMAEFRPRSEVQS